MDGHESKPVPSPQLDDFESRPWLWGPQKKKDTERKVSPDLSFVDASISLVVYEVGKPVIAP